MKKYLDTTLTAKERAEALLSEMTTEEKAFQLSAEMFILRDSTGLRDYRVGNVRNPAHFIHWNFEDKKTEPKTVTEVVDCINEDVKRSMEANRFSIPVLEHGEALHGAQWGMATCFPQPIGLASTFDDALVEKTADCIGRECRAVGVRQVLSPVINVCRDSRWGRAMETFGEDVLLSSNMGLVTCKGFDQNGVIATPKHFVDNYGDGGRDSNSSNSSERTLREVYYKPFEKCVKSGYVKSIMSAYNLVDGVPCACSDKLLNKVLREEWGFDGFIVSDYGGIDNIQNGFCLVDESYKSQSLAMNNGHDVTLPWHSHEEILKAVDEGYLSIEQLDVCVLRVLTQKIRLGLLDGQVFANGKDAEKLVRNQEAKDLAYKGARESIVLLKNDNCLPISKTSVKKIGVFGQSANKVPVGENYSGPFGGWVAKDAQTPMQALESYLEGFADVVYYNSDDAQTVAEDCDAVIYFTSVIEGEGLDRCELKLPKARKTQQTDGSGFIVDKRELQVFENQEETILNLAKNNKNTIVVLLNGGPIDTSNWIEDVASVVEAWYPGEQGGRAIAELIFGEYSPSGKLPITFPRSVGQLPLYYSYKPSGRGYAYNENDGTPLYPFGYGLSYTQFEIKDCKIEAEDLNLAIAGKISNVGRMDGAEVVQVYIRGKNCEVVRPVKELKGYSRIEVKTGRTVDFKINLDSEAFYFYDKNMNFGAHDSDYDIMIGTSSNDILFNFKVKIKGGKIVF